MNLPKVRQNRQLRAIAKGMKTLSSGRGRVLSVVAALLVGWSGGAILHADPETRAVQERLKNKGLYFGEVTGESSPETTNALRRYQVRSGLTVSGELDPQTAASLGMKVPRQPAAVPPAPGVPTNVVESDRDFLRGGEDSAPAELPPQKAPVREDRAPAKKNTSVERSQKTTEEKLRPQPAQEEAAPAITAEEVRTLLTRYLHAGETDNLDAQTAFFSDRVDYFRHGMVGRRFIRQDTATYNRRWPSRQYELLRDLEVRPGGTPGRVQAHFRLRFQVGRGTNSARGVTANTATIQRENGRLKIVALKERLLSRR